MPIRAGSDIAFLGGHPRYIIENDRYFKEYVVNYTNAPAIINDEFQDTEDLDGLFSGWNEQDQYGDNGRRSVEPLRNRKQRRRCRTRPFRQIQPCSIRAACFRS